ncbi:MAG: acyl-CoA dehydrogenase [Gammaproteobacteria bacterium]
MLIPAERECDENERVPEAIVDQMRAFGLFGLSVPEEFGGLGLNMLEEAQVIAALCRASPSYRSLIGTTVGVGGKSIVLDGTPAQRQRYLPGIARGEIIVSFCLTEPDSGSDAAALRTRATRDAHGYVLNGTKRFISNSPNAGLFMVLARTDSDKESAGISAFLVDAATPGITVMPAYKKMGHRAAPVADVVFTDCRVPVDALLGAQEGQGFRTARKVLNDGRIHVGAVAVGLATRLMEESVNYAKERHQFGHPIAEFQLIQGMLADGETDLLAARALVESAASARDAGGNVAKEAAAAKYFASEALWRIADRAVQIHGGYGYMSELPVERLFRDARLLRIFEGTSQVMQVVIARELLRTEP